MSHSYKVQPQHQDAFDALVERICEKHRNEWESVTDLPRLTERDYATVLRAFPDTFDDIRPDELSVADALDQGGAPAASEAISLQILMQMQASLRLRLLQALQDHVEEDDEGSAVDRASLQYISEQL